VGAYLLRRIGASIIVLLGISIFMYLMLHEVFPSPARVVLGLRANSAQIASWNQQNGYDRPVVEQYLSYMNGLLHGNLGFSYAENQTVAACSRSGWPVACTCPVSRWSSRS